MFSGNVFIRTVTHNYIATVTGPVVDGMIPVASVSWVADTGCRLGQFLTSGPSPESEIEPMPTCCGISVGAVVDVSSWAHALPTRAQ